MIVARRITGSAPLKRPSLGRRTPSKFSAAGWVGWRLRRLRKLCSPSVRFPPCSKATASAKSRWSEPESLSALRMHHYAFDGALTKSTGGEFARPIRVTRMDFCAPTPRKSGERPPEIIEIAQTDQMLGGEDGIRTHDT